MLSQLKELYPKKVKYNHEEEHIFQIKEKNENKTVTVTPLFIDNKIISKCISIRENDIKLIPKEFIDVVKFLQDNKICSSFGYESFLFTPRIYKFIDKIQKYKNLDDIDKTKFRFFIDKSKYDELPEKERNKSICIPYNDFKKIIFLKEEKKSKIFLEFLHENHDLLLNLFGENIFEILGYPEKIVENSEKIIYEILEKDILYEIYYYFSKENSLEFPVIKHNMINFSINNIFRVFKPDPNYISKKEKNRLKDWSGRLISNKILSYLNEKNIIRICIHEKSNITWFNTYFQILKKIENDLFLVCSCDPYIDELEDSILLVNSFFINEIPVDWKGNENLIENIEYIDYSNDEQIEYNSNSDYSKIFNS